MEESITSSKLRRFYLFRYQILPRIDPQESLVYSTPERNYNNLNELVEDKNHIFLNMIQKIEFKWPYSKISHEVVHFEEDSCLVRLGVNRPTVLRTEDFKSFSTNDWPWIYIFIDNSPQNQIIAVEINRDAWDSPDITINMLTRNFNDYLKTYFLSVLIEPIIEKNAFWDFVEENKGKIKVVEFDMISPNMSNISENSKWPLREIRNEYNATRQKFRLENSESTSLDIKKDELIESLADYSSLGGGCTRFKIKGLRQFKSLKGDTKTIEIDEIDFVSEDRNHFHLFAQLILSIIRKL